MLLHIALAVVAVACLVAFAIVSITRGWLKAWVLVVIRLFPWLNADLRRRRVPRRQPCLACGAGGRKELRWDPVEKLVIVQCPVCMAAWGYNPVVNAGKFSKPVTTSEEK